MPVAEGCTRWVVDGCGALLLGDGVAMMLGVAGMESCSAGSVCLVCCVRTISYPGLQVEG